MEPELILSPKPSEQFILMLTRNAPRHGLSDKFINHYLVRHLSLSLSSFGSIEIEILMDEPQHRSRPSVRDPSAICHAIHRPSMGGTFAIVFNAPCNRKHNTLFPQMVK